MISLPEDYLANDFMSCGKLEVHVSPVYKFKTLTKYIRKNNNTEKL